MSAVAPSELDLRGWADLRGYSLGTVRGWRADFDDFPRPSRRSGTSDQYFVADLDRWKRKHPTLGLGRGGHKRKAGEP